MTIVIITKQPRLEWNGLNVKKYNHIEIEEAMITKDGISLFSNGLGFPIRIHKDEITSITITY